MADVQLEKGFTRIANELLEAICGKIHNIDYLRLILFIIRITYGYNRKRTQSGYKSFSRFLNMPKDKIEITLSELYLRKVIFFEYSGKECFFVELNKNYEEWQFEEYHSIN
jgi:phage replication O-like protein O